MPGRLLRAATLACGLWLPFSACAELSNDSLLGPGLRWRPAYDGSDSQRVELVPVLRYFGQHWFARSTQGVLESGVRAELAPGLNAGAQLAYEPGRATGESDFLRSHNAANVHRGASAGLHVEWDHLFDPVPVTFLARARQNMDSSLGAQVDLRLTAGVYKGGPIGAGVFTQTTWANAKSTSAYYGITSQQSTTMGLPAFEAGSGWLFTSFGLLWSIALSPPWLVVGSAEARRLHGDAAQSPLTERASKHYASVGIAYRY
jgi:outer membrane scaffolding protein for murein synthesis (MipA/OmpV family)